jgi:hypothetical protein
MPSINARRILAQRIDPNRLGQLDRLRIEAAIHDAYALGFGAGADWQATQTINTPLTGRL